MYWFPGDTLCSGTDVPCFLCWEDSFNSFFIGRGDGYYQWSKLSTHKNLLYHTGIYQSVVMLVWQHVYFYSITLVMELTSRAGWGWGQAAGGICFPLQEHIYSQVIIIIKLRGFRNCCSIMYYYILWIRSVPLWLVTAKMIFLQSQAWNKMDNIQERSPLPPYLNTLGQSKSHECKFQLFQKFSFRNLHLKKSSFPFS